MEEFHCCTLLQSVGSFGTSLIDSGITYVDCNYDHGEAADVSPRIQKRNRNLVGMLYEA